MLGRRHDIVYEHNLSGSSTNQDANDAGTRSMKEVFDAYGSSIVGPETNFITICFELKCSNSMFATFNQVKQIFIQQREWQQ